MKVRVSGDESSEKNVISYLTESPDEVGLFAKDLIERWGLVLVEPYGEDSSGRQTLRALRPGDMVTRAFDVAEEFYRQTNSRGHMVTLPDLNEVNAAYDARRAARAAEGGA